MQNYITNAGGYLTNPDATSGCQFCSVRTTDQFLGPSFNIVYSHHWRNLGFLMAFILFNVSVPHILVVVEQIEKYVVGRLPLYLHIYIPHPHKRPPCLAEETIHSQKCLEMNSVTKMRSCPDMFLQIMRFRHFRVSLCEARRKGTEHQCMPHET